MIVKITDATEIRPGQFVCCEPIIINAVCHYPRKVEWVSGQRILYLNNKNEKKHFMRKTALFLCDTFEEAHEIYQLGFKRQAEIKAAMEEAFNRVMGEYEPKIAKLISDTPPAASGT